MFSFTGGDFKGMAFLYLWNKCIPMKENVKDHFTASSPHFPNSCCEGHSVKSAIKITSL